MSDHYGLLNWHCHGGTNLFRVKAKDASNRYVLTEDDDPESDQPGDGLDNMTNDRLYSIVYSICCGIAAFDDYHPHGDWYMGESMAEGFTNMFGHICGPNLLGNTRNGLQISSPALQKEFYDLLTTGTQDPGSGESYFHLGVSELVSKQNYNSHYLRYSHNLFGCPETQIWTDTPSEFTNVSITDNGTSITVNSGVSGCDICVSSGNNGADYHLLASDVSSYTFTTDVRPLYITVTKHNFIPYTAVTGGTFTSAETWFGNLHALGSVTFDGNSTLEVLPGTKVLFDSKYNLCIKAGSKIIAEGTESSPVYFTSTDGTSRESWGTLYVYSSDNVFKWCIVEYGDWGLKLYGNPSPASNNIVENCTFRTNDQGLRMEKNEVDVISCNIYDNRHNVVTMYNTQIDMEKITAMAEHPPATVSIQGMRMSLILAGFHIPTGMVIILSGTIIMTRFIPIMVIHKLKYYTILFMIIVDMGFITIVAILRYGLCCVGEVSFRLMFLNFTVLLM